MRDGSKIFQVLPVKQCLDPWFCPNPNRQVTKLKKTKMERRSEREREREREREALASCDRESERERSLMSTKLRTVPTCEWLH